jgi:hypothetical protein
VPEKKPRSATTAIPASRQPRNALKTVSYKSQGPTGKEKRSNADYRTPEPPEETHSRDDKTNQDNDGQELNERESPLSIWMSLREGHIVGQRSGSLARRH